jgi:hypothetical protein
MEKKTRKKKIKKRRMKRGEHGSMGRIPNRFSVP